MNGWENYDVCTGTRFISFSFLLIFFHVFPSTMAMCRRWSFCTPFAPNKSLEWIGMVRNLAPRRCLEQILRLLSAKKKILDLVVIRIVPAWTATRTLSLSPSFHHYSFFFITCYVTRSVLLRPSSLFSNTWRRSRAIFLGFLKTTFNNVKTKDFKSWFQKFSRLTVMPRKCLTWVISFIIILVYYIIIYLNDLQYIIITGIILLLEEL